VPDTVAFVSPLVDNTLLLLLVLCCGGGGGVAFALVSPWCVCTLPVLRNEKGRFKLGIQHLRPGHFVVSIPLLFHTQDACSNSRASSRTHPPPPPPWHEWHSRVDVWHDCGVLACASPDLSCSEEKCSFEAFPSSSRSPYQQVAKQLAVLPDDSIHCMTVAPTTLYSFKLGESGKEGSKGIECSEFDIRMA